MRGIAVIAALAFCIAREASAEIFPDNVFPARPVRLIIPYASGGGAEITARAVAKKLDETLNQPFIIDTRPGVDTSIASEIVATARPDGYTLIVADPAITIPSVGSPKPRFTVSRGFLPIAVLATTPYALLAHPSFKYSLSELSSMAKAETSKLAVGTAGPASAMAYQWLRAKTGLALKEAPYKDAAPALTDVLGGNVLLLFIPLSAAVPHIKSGQLKALALSTAARHTAVLDVPTFREGGVDLVAADWYGVLAPVKTPIPVALKLNQSINAALQAPEVRARFTPLALDVKPLSLDEYHDLVQSELRRWKEVVSNTKVRIQ